MVEATGELNSHSILKVPIAKIGKWAHPTYGAVEFTEDDLNAAISNFKEGALGFEPHLSFGHLDEEPASTDSARKRGNLKYLMKDGECLDGYFSVPRGTAEVVSRGEFEYSSGEFIRNLMDKDSGDHRGMAISRVALTNTPYLPWGEEGKIQLLSQTGNSPSDIVTSVIKLSTAEGSTGESMTQSTTEQVVPPTVAIPPELAPVITPVANAAAGLDVSAITAAILAEVKIETDRLKAEQDAQLKVEQDRLKAEKEAADVASKAQVSELEKKMSEMAEELARVKTEASQFSNHASMAAQEAEVQQLMSMGASAVLANKYAAIRSAVQTNSTVVKLSQGDAVKESPLMESIRELLMGALQQTPVVTTQMGLAGGPHEQEGGVKGYLEKAISENRQKANKVSI